MKLLFKGAKISLVSLVLSGVCASTTLAKSNVSTTSSESSAPVQKISGTKISGAKKSIAAKKSEAKKNAAANAEEKREEKKLAGLKIAKISVAGNRKIEADAIVSALHSKVGQNFDKTLIREDVSAVYKMGFFYNVEVTRNVTPDGVTLNYLVVEKPTIAEIKFHGQVDMTEDELRDAAGLKAYEIVSTNQVRTALDKLQKFYEDKGYFLAHITYRLEELEKGQTVRLVFDVEENDKVRVKRISFIGNKSILAGTLKSRMLTQEGGFFSFLSGSGTYKQEAFDRDAQMITFAYFNEGYVQVKVDRPQVTVTPDKKGIFITFYIEEGEQFSVGKVDFSGDLLFTRDEMFESTEIQKSDIFVYETLQKDLRTVQAKYGDLGYAFANIIPRTSLREKERLVDITFEIDKGNKVYFGKFNMKGNSKTRDKVIRREMKIFEGELYNETRKRQSLDNIKRLGFFEDANFNSSTPPDQPDIMNLEIAVKERNTGSIQVGAGYSSGASGGFLFNGQLNQTNFLGRGQKLGLSIDYSSNSSLFNLSFTEPYYMDSDWSLGFDLYQSRRILQIYKETKLGAAVRVGHPLAEYLYGYLRYKNDNTNLENTDLTDPELFPLSTANGITSSLTATIEYDKRNDRFTPSDGFYSNLSVEYAGPGGTKRFTKTLANARYYQKLFGDLVFKNNLVYGNLSAEIPPFNELFLLGGANSLRGYSWYSVGRKKFSTLKGQYLPYGGTQQLYYNGEFEFGLITEAGIKGILFYDIGQADDIVTKDAFKSDAGFGFRWFSPIGPLRFEWGFPFNRGVGDDSVNFEFAIGQPF